MKQLILVLAFLLTGLWTEHLSAKVVLKSATQIELNEGYDSMLNLSMKKRLDSYKRRMDQSVTRRIGTVSKRMSAGRPESTLSNFLADQLLEKAKKLSSKKVDLSVINMGGIRASINKGVLTVGDLYKVAPFEDVIVLVTLNGKDVMSLFHYMAKVGGEGLSGARLTLRKKKVVQATVNGEAVDADAEYTVATIDYLAQGNAGFTVFLRALAKNKLNCKARDCYIEQIEQLTAQGKNIHANLDGRITILP